MIYTIIREKWLRGEGDECSFLLRSSDGKMCCFGQIMLQSGAHEGQIIEQKNPISTPVLERLSKPLGFTAGDLNKQLTYSDECGDMMAFNDDESISDETREHLLKIEASKLGHTLIFI